jgi:hypothetical protein
MQGGTFARPEGELRRGLGNRGGEVAGLAGLFQALEMLLGETLGRLMIEVASDPQKTRRELARDRVGTGQGQAPIQAPDVVNLHAVNTGEIFQPTAPRLERYSEPLGGFDEKQPIGSRRPAVDGQGGAFAVDILNLKHATGHNAGAFDLGKDVLTQEAFLLS